tara:strand:- start:400 stop:1164 length:765 start_codon:yes stop_codon:yes gene_type:complete
MMGREYTVILNYYNKSVSLLRKQIKTILNQTMRPECIWACFMGGDERDNLLRAFQEETIGVKNAHFILSDYNFKYIGRYQLALTAPTDYIVMLDDDRFPDEGYCEAMVSILEKEDCLVQQYGWVLKTPRECGGKFLLPFMKQCNSSMESDKSALTKASYLCGGMAFRKSSLKYLFNEDVYTVTTGEDIMFCMRCQKNGIPVYVHQPSLKENSRQFLYHDPEGINYTATTPHIADLRTQIIQRETTPDSNGQSHI